TSSGRWSSEWRWPEMTSISCFGLLRTLAIATPKKKVCNFVGGVVSPILANIYLHEFDECMEQKKQEFDKGKARRQTTEWLNTTFYIRYYRKRIDALKGDTNPEAQTMQERYVQKIRELSEKQKRLAASDPLDPTYR